MDFIALFIFFAACKKSEVTVPVTPVVPAVPVIASLNTSLVTALAITTATSGGNITDDGGSAVTERGVCYGISVNPLSQERPFRGAPVKEAFR